jgi:PHD/YefM family antitoxin component YafN of YafNO toxin-antitoxin module
MLNLVNGIDTLTNFKRDTARFLKRLRETKGPVVLTINGKAELVVLAAASYQALIERVERLEAVAAVKEGLEDVAAGRTRPAREALEELARKHKVKATKGK